MYTITLIVITSIVLLKSRAIRSPCTVQQITQLSTTTSSPKIKSEQPISWCPPCSHLPQVERSSMRLDVSRACVCDAPSVLSLPPRHCIAVSILSVTIISVRSVHVLVMWPHCYWISFLTLLITSFVTQSLRSMYFSKCRVQICCLCVPVYTRLLPVYICM